MPDQKSAILNLAGAARVFAAGSALAQQQTPQLKLDIGWSTIQLDKTEFTAVTDFFVTDVTGHDEDHDGELNGYRLTGEIGNLLPYDYKGLHTQFAVKGFYSSYESQQNSRCTFTEQSDCAMFPLFDPNPSGRATDDGGKLNPTIFGPDYSGGFFSDWHTRTDREAVHLGAALELRLDRPAAAPASTKDGSVAVAPKPVPFQWRVGVAARKLDQELSLEATDFGPTQDPVTLHDDLDTTYYGAYLGFTTSRELREALRMVISGEAGLYYSDAHYQGRYTASDSLGGGAISQSLSLDQSKAAFIGSVNVGLERDLSWGTIGLFGEAEWISHVPTVLYNDTDRNGGFPFDAIGTQDGTELGNGSALSYTVGLRASVPTR
jgi:hypothetical protein